MPVAEVFEAFVDPAITTRFWIWGGEFGRTVYSQGKLTPTDHGRDHHPRCFSLWLAGGGAKPNGMP